MILRLRKTFLICILFMSVQANAGMSILDPTSFTNGIPADVADAAVKTFGIYLSHRPYQGAVSMFGNNSLDIKLEVTMMKVGEGIFKAMAANGMSAGTSSSNNALPIAKVHLRKSMSPAVDIGFSGIVYSGQRAYGGDIKIELSNPEEGISTALRFGYSYASSSLLYLKSATVISPEFVASRKLNFAEPYLGVGGRYLTGTIAIPYDAGPLGTIMLEKAGSGYTAYAFTGVNFQILGPAGFRLGMEGTYDISGFSSIGTVFGIGF